MKIILTLVLAILLPFLVLASDIGKNLTIEDRLTGEDKKLWAGLGEFRITYPSDEGPTFNLKLNIGMVFSGDNTIVYVMLEADDSGASFWEPVGKGRWKLKDNRLIIISDGDKTEYKIDFNGNLLFLHEEGKRTIIFKEYGFEFIPRKGEI